jgi:hypothetical protein
MTRIPGRNRTKADIVFRCVDGHDVALKDYSPRPFLIRHTLGRLLLAREARAYRAAGVVSGLPRFLGRPDRFSLMLTRVPGRPLSDTSRDAIGVHTFDRLDAIVTALHDRGVALGDLHHRDVLIADDGDVHVVDLATAWTVGDRSGRFRRAVFDRMCDQDRVALARLRARHLGGDESAAIASVGVRAAAWHRRGRRLKAATDRLRRRS